MIEGIDRSVEEAAFNLGATPFQMARRVLFPLAMPGILAGTILTFILAMNAYATPVLLGGPRFQMMGPLVYGQFVQQNNWPFGGAIAFILMTATLILTLDREPDGAAALRAWLSTLIQASCLRTTHRACPHRRCGHRPL